MMNMFLEFRWLSSRLFHRLCGRLGSFLSDYQAATNGTLQVRPGYPVVPQSFDVFTTCVDLVLLRQEQLIHPDEHTVVIKLGFVYNPLSKGEDAIVMVFGYIASGQKPFAYLPDFRTNIDCQRS